MMDIDDISKAIKKEIGDLHSYFENYFAGKIEKSRITRLENCLTSDFKLITPIGVESSREELISMITDSYGSNPDMQILTDNIRIFPKGDNLYLAMYEESQKGDPKSRRISSALFSYENHQLKWSHVHETYI